MIMWAGSGAATLFQVDRAAGILELGGIGKGAARAIAIGGGWLDIVLAIALIWRPAVRPVLLAMIVLTIFYLVGATAIVPGLWNDPLAPLAKTVPAALLALVAYWTLERR